jgi:hypothetical protein
MVEYKKYLLTLLLSYGSLGKGVCRARQIQARILHEATKSCTEYGSIFLSNIGVKIHSNT